MFTGRILYASNPPEVANTIRDTIRSLNSYTSGRRDYQGWEDLPNAGQVIFCEICKAIRHSRLVVADITTLNFNVLFEVGYAYGLGLPVLPVRDLTYERDSKLIQQIGVFDTVAYESYSNSQQLGGVVQRHAEHRPYELLDPAIDTQRPLYLLKSPHDTEISVALGGVLSAAAFQFRVFDSREKSRLGLNEAVRAVRSSLGVVCHLIDSNRAGSAVHNARCAFVAGLAMAAEKEVLLLSDGAFDQPIDYRDVVRHASSPAIGRSIAEDFRERIARRWERLSHATYRMAADALHRVDFGDPAAENEGQRLKEYFLPTAGYQAARAGKVTLVVGRKGAGKTAILERILAEETGKIGRIVLDLRPDGPQLATFRDVVLDRLSEGLRGHTLTAFWNYLLLQEVARAILVEDRERAYQDPPRLGRYERLRSASAVDVHDMEQDFPERLMRFVGRLREKFRSVDGAEIREGELTSAIYRSDLVELQKALEDYVGFFDSVTVLVDNLDKGWVEGRVAPADTQILRSLLDAANRFRTRLVSRGLDFRLVVFLRTDVWRQLVRSTSDRGKDSSVNLQWEERSQFCELIRRRVEASGLPAASFEEAWANIAVGHVGGRPSFDYILGRSLGRPRDLLNFVVKCQQNAINSGRQRIEDADIRSAERSYSLDLLSELELEMAATGSLPEGCLWRFGGKDHRITRDDAELVLMDAGVHSDAVAATIERLVWFGFFGYARSASPDEALYAHDTAHSLELLASRAIAGGCRKDVLQIHPGFRAALSGG